MRHDLNFVFCDYCRLLAFTFAWNHFAAVTNENVNAHNLDDIQLLVNSHLLYFSKDKNTKEAYMPGIS